MFSEDQFDEIMARVEANLMEIESQGTSASVADKRRVVTESIGPLGELIEGLRYRIGKLMVDLNEFVEGNGESFSDDDWACVFEMLCQCGDRFDSLDTELRKLYAMRPDHPVFAECESPLSQ